MKKLILFFAFILLSFIGYSQVDRYKSTYFTFRLYDIQKQELTPWYEWQDSDIEISINRETNSIFILSEEKHSFVLLDTLEQKFFEGKYITIIEAIDNKGRSCLVDFTKFEKSDKSFHLYFRWINKYEICYQIKKL